MVANPSIPSKTLPEFIAYAKTNPGKIKGLRGIEWANLGSEGVRKLCIS